MTEEVKRDNIVSPRPNSERSSLPDVRRAPRVWILSNGDFELMTEELLSSWSDGSFFRAFMLGLPSSSSLSTTDLVSNHSESSAEMYWP